MIVVTNGVSVLVQGALFIPHFAGHKGMLRIRRPVFHVDDIKRVLSNGVAFIFAGPVLMNILFFQTTERNVYATLIAFLRCIGFVQVFLLLFRVLFGTDGIYVSFAAGELCHFILSQILVRRTMTKIEKSTGKMLPANHEGPEIQNVIPLRSTKKAEHGSDK